MVDEYYERYRKVEHAQLYRELKAGSPRRIDGLADQWHTVSESLRAVAEDLRAELTLLLASWAGETSDELQFRVGLVATWAEVLSGEAESMRTGLTGMSTALTAAQREATPEPPPASEWAHDVTLASMLGLAATPEQRSQSQDSLARVIAELAVAYELTDHRAWSAPRLPAPTGLPGELLGTDPLGPPVEIGTQLAGQLSATPTIGPAHLSMGGLPTGVPGLDSAMIPGAARVPTTLSGASSGLASSPASADLTSRGADVTGSAGGGQALPPPVMGAGHVPASTTDQVTTGRSGQPDEFSWSARDDAGWDDPDDRPPAILGHPADSA